MAAFYEEKKTSDPKESVETVNTNPNWMSDLKKNFYQEVVLSCSTRTKEAVDKNEDVQVC